MEKGEGQPGGRGIGKIVVQDVLRGDLKRSLRRDLRDLYEFYIDEASRARLARMGRLRRGFRATLWLLRALLLNLSPGRRVLLVAGLTIGLGGGFGLEVGGVGVRGDFSSVGVVLLLVVLML